MQGCHSGGRKQSFVLEQARSGAHLAGDLDAAHFMYALRLPAEKAFEKKLGVEVKGGRAGQEAVSDARRAPEIFDRQTSADSRTTRARTKRPAVQERADQRKALKVRGWACSILCSRAEPDPSSGMFFDCEQAAAIAAD